MASFRFEQDVMAPAVKVFLEQSFENVLKELIIPLDDWPSRVKRVIPDLLALAQSGSMILECKKHSTPYSIGSGLGEGLMQREILRREKSKIEEKKGIQIREPIRLGAVLPRL